MADSKSTQSQKSWRDIYPVHPSAEVFPQLPAKDLRALAEDIRANGLMNKVLIWNVSMEGGERDYLLDGRSRLDAMEIARMRILGDDGKLLPEFVETLADLSSMTAGALTVAFNIRRRHLPAEVRAKLAVNALKADQQFRKQMMQPSVPSGEDSPDGTSHDSEGHFKPGHTTNKSVVAHVAEAAKVDRKTARKATRALSAEEQLVRDKKRAQVIDLILEGVGRDTICKRLHVSPGMVARTRKEIGASKPKAVVASESKSSEPVAKRKNQDKRMLGILHEIDEIDPSDLSDPEATGQSLRNHAQRFTRYKKAV